MKIKANLYDRVELEVGMESDDSTTLRKGSQGTIVDVQDNPALHHPAGIERNIDS